MIIPLNILIGKIKSGIEIKIRLIRKILIGFDILVNIFIIFYKVKFNFTLYYEINLSL